MASKCKENSSRESEFYNLYENEFGSDVTLLVGELECQERLPAHSWVLASGSDYFKVLILGPLSEGTNKEYHFPADNVAGFNNLIRWLYQNKCDLQSLQSSLETLQVAIKYLCPELAVTCVNQITKQLTVKNVLRVIKFIQLYCTQYECDHHSNNLNENLVPSAPPLEEIENEVKKCTTESGVGTENFQDMDPTFCCQHLYNECLDIIDKNGDEVLNSEYLISASASYLKMILQRPTLKVSSELEVFKALSKWSTAECKRRHLPLTIANRRLVLGSLLFLPRFLIVTPSEFDSAKDELKNLLYTEELLFIGSYIKNPRSNNYAVPESLEKYVVLMGTPRSATCTSDTTVSTFDSKAKRKLGLKKKFNKKDFILDLVSLLALIFD